MVSEVDPTFLKDPQSTMVVAKELTDLATVLQV